MNRVLCDKDQVNRTVADHNKDRLYNVDTDGSHITGQVYNVGRVVAHVEECAHRIG